MEQENNTKETKKINRRDIIKGLAALPAFGILGYGLWSQLGEKQAGKANLLEDIGSIVPKGVQNVVPGDTIRIGLIGTGGRGRYLLKALGYLHPEEMDEYEKNASEDKWWKEYLEQFRQQDDLNVKITAVCDIFDVHAKKGMEAGANVHRTGTGSKLEALPKRYKTYQELVKSPEVDAVIIATPDHLHVPVAIEAARNGKHVYCEKPLSWTVPETYEVRKVVNETGIVFQLGHQGRQTESYQVAATLIRKGVLGKISLVEVCTNRNDPNGAWVYDINPEAGPHNIDWKQFIGPAPWHDFSLERFFRWRCWWDYSTGLSGDLFTHEFDALNQILGLGIPNSAIASGGIYFYKDGRTVPDVLNMAFEYPERDLTLLYSATLASEKKRGKVIMGHDGYMQLDETLLIMADPRSTKYGDKINEGIIEPNKPIFSYVPGQEKVDAITTATEKYFAERGLLYTYRDGKAYDTSHLHLREWLNCIRLKDGSQPSCNINAAFEEAIAAHMGTISYHENRKVFWDATNEKIV